MLSLYTLFALVLAVNLGVGLVRVLRGPHLADRLLAAQLFGTTGVALLLTLAALQMQPSLRDVALVFALLGLLAVVAFTRLWPTAAGRGDDSGSAATHGADARAKRTP